MIYLSAEYILSAIKQLASTHAFIGITFLTCKKNNLPVGSPIEFMMDFTYIRLSVVHDLNHHLGS